MIYVRQQPGSIVSLRKGRPRKRHTKAWADLQSDKLVAISECETERTVIYTDSPHGSTLMPISPIRLSHIKATCAALLQKYTKDNRGCERGEPTHATILALTTRMHYPRPQILFHKHIRVHIRMHSTQVPRFSAE